MVDCRGQLGVPGMARDGGWEGRRGEGGRRMEELGGGVGGAGSGEVHSGTSRLTPGVAHVVLSSFLVPGRENS